MIVEHSLVREHQQEITRHAQELHLASRIAGVNRAKRQRARAERQLERAWRRLEELWDTPAIS
jgi:hypothetical protein